MTDLADSATLLKASHLTGIRMRLCIFVPVMYARANTVNTSPNRKLAIKLVDAFFFPENKTKFKLKGRGIFIKPASKMKDLIKSLILVKFYEDQTYNKKDIWIWRLQNYLLACHLWEVITSFRHLWEFITSFHYVIQYDPAHDKSYNMTCATRVFANCMCLLKPSGH